MKNNLVKFLCLWLLFGVLLTDAFAQTQPANKWDKVKQAARLRRAQQEEINTQKILQDWFIAKIQFYQSVLDDTAIGQSNPKIVNLGDWTARFKQVLAPPTGKGTTLITFGDRAAPSTMEDNMEIIFPQANADAYIDGHPDTCWHEFNHILVLLSERNGRPVAIPSSPWMVYAKPGDNSNPEHIYMEGLAEYTVEWLDLLLHERSVLTGGAGMAFEKHCRDAYEQIKKYQARNESVSFAVENFCWAKAHDAYCRAWKQAGHKVAPLPLNFRQDYQQICGVWIGFVEDIVTFYMKGGLKAADGTAIKVPEWVMNPDPMRTGIILGHLNEKKNISGDILRYSFDIRVLENYRRKERSESLNHGKVMIKLTNPDNNTKLELSVDGKPINRSADSGKIDLSGFKKDSTIGLTFVHSALSDFVGVKRYSITIEYQPEPRIENGVEKPPFYYPSKAIYYIDVTGRGKSSKTKPVPVPIPPSAPKTIQEGNKNNTGNGVWKFVEIIKDKRVDPSAKSQNITCDASFSDTTIQIHGKQQLTNPSRTVTWNSKHTWKHPGQTLIAEKTIAIDISISSSDPGPFCKLEAWTQKEGRVSRGLFDHPTSGGKQSCGGIASLHGVTTTRNTINVPIPNGEPDEELFILFYAWDSYIIATACFRYIWDGNAKTAENPDTATQEADAVLKAEEPETEQEPAGMDNIPPKPGELVKIKKLEEEAPPPPPKTKNKFTATENWYVHPTGDYKFKLSPGWTVSKKTFFDENDEQYDTLWPSGKDMAVVCSRDFTDNESKNANTVLNAFATKMLKANPNARSVRTKLGMADVQQIANFDKNAGVMTWHLGIFYKGRSYYISISMPAQAEAGKIPDQSAWMLNSIIFNR